MTTTFYEYLTLATTYAAFIVHMWNVNSKKKFVNNV